MSRVRIQIMSLVLSITGHGRLTLLWSSMCIPLSGHRLDFNTYILLLFGLLVHYNPTRSFWTERDFCSNSLSCPDDGNGIEWG